MKKTFRTMLVAFVAVSIVAFVGCDKEDGGGNGGNGTEQPTPNPTPTPTPNPQPTVNWVDLALPSGLLWAECNVGATAPEGYGDYFAWGETATKEVYNWSTYRYCTVNGEGSLASLTKYNTRTPFGTVDNLTTLEPGDDAATANMGDGARTPTKADWQELMDNTNAVWDTVNGVKGRTFTAANGNSLFLPAAGRRHGSELEYDGSYGIYWSASLVEDQPSRAWRFIFNSDDQSMSNCRRCNGPAVRPVRSARCVQDKN